MQEQDIQLRPDFLFEVSWEVCNKIGGVHTVISSKTPYSEQQFGANYILLGPDIEKENDENGIFIEDRKIFQEWVNSAHADGLSFRIGRWLIPGNPVVILVNYKNNLSMIDKVLENMWLTYKLDSLSGNWDYKEPALFGYFAAKIIEHFYKFMISSYDKLIVHCHEWKTGLCLLELKKNVQQAGLVFTIHNTTLGRAMANANLPVYDRNFDFNYIISQNEYNISAKYHLEKSAAELADCFTVVSNTLESESEHFLGVQPMVVTPNGFNLPVSFKDTDIATFKQNARKKIQTFAERFFGKSVSEDTVFLFSSGMYELKNKGIDVFLESLNQLKANSAHQKYIVFLAISATHSGPVQSVQERIQNPVLQEVLTGTYLTHHLLNEESDPVLNYLRQNNISNQPDDNVKVIFIPAYLDGKDKIINMKYYEFLSGIDISVFPSFYDTWGYTPMESLACGTPTITTSLTGFGAWVNQKFSNNSAIKVLDRNPQEQSNFAELILQAISYFSATIFSDKNHILHEALSISKQFSWEYFIPKYWSAYNEALIKTFERKKEFEHKTAISVPKQPTVLSPVWYKVKVNTRVPDKLKPLQELSQNLWWSWNAEAIKLFESVSPELWQKAEKNPIILLELLDIKQLKRIEQDEVFIQNMLSVYTSFRNYMESEPSDKDTIVYFCMEYGLHSSVKLYSGGLGILAGDYLKEASDTNRNLVAVGLLYRYGYFHQIISHFGDQISEKIPQKFSQLPLQPVRNKAGDWIHVSMNFPGRTVKAKAWKLPVGRISLYLLDTDIEENNEQDRSITGQLYESQKDTNELRFKQELVLGIGGMRLLRALNIEPSLFHLNEGHAAFLNLERMRWLINEAKLNYGQAVEILRSSSLFTTHTPVPAGHDYFDEHLLRTYLSHYPERFNITWEQFMNLGRYFPNNSGEKFSMSVLALRLSQECNGVSRLHGKVTRNMFASMYNGYFPEELHISHITNGVHYSTWAAPEWQNILKGNSEHSIDEILNTPALWEHINALPDEQIWNLRNEFRARLIDFINSKIASDYRNRLESPKLITETLEALNPNALTLGFARRFATYKRATLMFRNPEKLAKILNNPERPVRLLFAGKAHPADVLGQEFIKKIIEFSKLPEFIGKVIFLENYDADLALKMVQGVDIWLNTPTRPQEASGTSGQKCVMNGVLHFSVLDGWWAEGYIPKAGWALKEARTYTDQSMQDELDADTIYSLLENEIVPLFYKRSSNGIPCEWVQYIKKNLTAVSPHYTTRRMMNEYFEKYYYPMMKRCASLKEHNFDIARKISAWKKKTEILWDNIYIAENKCYNSTTRALELGEKFHAEVVVATAGINPEELVVELTFGQKNMDKVDSILFSEKLDLQHSDEKSATFQKDIEIRKSGVFDYAIRIYATHPDLPYPSDSSFIKWG